MRLLFTVMLPAVTSLPTIFTGKSLEAVPIIS